MLITFVPRMLEHFVRLDWYIQQGRIRLEPVCVVLHLTSYLKHRRVTEVKFRCSRLRRLPFEKPAQEQHHVLLREMALPKDGATVAVTPAGSDGSARPRGHFLGSSETSGRG